MDRWTELRAFVAIADSESMTKAADTLRPPTSGISMWGPLFLSFCLLHLIPVVEQFRALVEQILRYC